MWQLVQSCDSLSAFFIAFSRTDLDNRHSFTLVTMRSPNEFWLCLHVLARAIDAEGRTDDERRVNIVATLEQMHTVA